MDEALPPFLDDDRGEARTHPGVSVTWVLPFAYGAVVFLASLFWLLQGRLFDRDVYRAVTDIPYDAIDAATPALARMISAAIRLAGVAGICAGIAFMAIAATGFRRGERWAWYALWALPLHATLGLATLAAYGALTATDLVWHLGLLVLALAGLAIPYRAFFGEPRA